MFTRAIIDFDDTLFNAKLLKDDIAAVFGEFGVGPQIFWESYKEARNSRDGKMLYTFTFERQLQVLTKDYIFIDIDQAKQRLNGLLTNQERYVFPDAAEFLATLKSRGTELILLSLGEENFQFKKLENSRLAKFFNQVFLVSDSKLNILSQILGQESSQNVLVNDKIKETQEIASRYPELRAVLKTRSDVPLSEYANSGLPHFNTLTDIKDYLEHQII